MDALDQQLLALLRADARTSVAQLAKELQVARGTIRSRIKRLESEGTITGYRVCRSLGASQRAARAEVAAVRSAVVTVNSYSKRGYPVFTAARTPNAVTVRRPSDVLPGCPLTYLNE